MILGHLGHATIIVNFDSFSESDTDKFTSYWHKWLNDVNKTPIANHESYHHLLNIATNNSLALNETSSSITSKWTNLFKEDENWKSFFENSPCTISVTKVIWISFS